MNLTISTADNGYVLTYQDEENKEVRNIVVEDTDRDCDCPSEARITQKLLLEILEYFAIWGSKHDDERIKVSVVNQKGEEVE